MKEQLKILMLEDSPDDVDLVERELKRAGLRFTCTVVKRKDEFEKALKDFRPDIILSDHSLPQFNSIEAMEIWKEWQRSNNVTIPFILITGSVSEEFAVQSIKAGADDYILKDRLKRLPASIGSALEKARLEREKTNALANVMSQAALLKEAEHLARFGSWQVDLATGKHQWSDEAFRIFGYTPGELDPDFDIFFRHVHAEDKESLQKLIDQAIRNQAVQDCGYRITSRDGHPKYLHSRILVKRDDNNRAYQLTGFTLDITEYKKQTEALELQNQKLMDIAWVQSHQVRAPLARLMGLVQLLSRYPEGDVDLKDSLKFIMDSANELDEIIRKIVRKTEEIV